MIPVMILTLLKTSWWWFIEEWNHTMVLRVQIKSSYDLLLFKYDYCIITWITIHDSLGWIPVQVTPQRTTSVDTIVSDVALRNINNVVMIFRVSCPERHQWCLGEGGQINNISSHVSLGSKLIPGIDIPRQIFSKLKEFRLSKSVKTKAK